MAKTAIKKKSNLTTLIVVLIVIILGVVIFLLVKNSPIGTNSSNPEANTSQVVVKDAQFNAISASADSSEPNDAATTLDPSNVVDSSGLN